MSSSGSSLPVDVKPDHRFRARPGTRALPVAVGTLLIGAVLLAPAPARADAAEFDRAVRGVAGDCVRGPATVCARRFFALADHDRDGVADLEEIQRLDASMRGWTNSHAESLDPIDLRALQVGFLLVDTIGIEYGMLLYDEDGDGGISLAEATADLNLDDRPLPELVQTGELVNWPSLRRRFGATAMLFDYLEVR
jgi:hypothetical protein